MKEIKLTQNKVALVDDEDFELLSKYSWCASKTKSTYYAMAYAVNSEGKRTTVMMHRIIMDVTGRKIWVDHRDHDGLNNQRNNLRIATISQNSSNRSSKKNSASKFLGVGWSQKAKKWQVAIYKDGKHKYIGLFESEEGAALAYNNAAKELHGEFANLNKIAS